MVSERNLMGGQEAETKKENKYFLEENKINELLKSPEGEPINCVENAETIDKILSEIAADSLNLQFIIREKGKFIISCTDNYNTFYEGEVCIKTDENGEIVNIISEMISPKEDIVFASEKQISYNNDDKESLEKVRARLSTNNIAS